MEQTLCIHCGEPIHLATDAEKSRLTCKSGNDWKHDSRFWYCQDEKGNRAEPAPKQKKGKTLADFAGSVKLFKRPKHRNPYGFPAGSDQLREICFEISGGDSFADWPRLTAEDLTATDWEEVPE